MQAASHLDSHDIKARIEQHIRLIDIINRQIKRTNIHHEIDTPANCCSHELVKLCMKKMEQDTCIDPVIETWKIFNSCYDTIERDLFLQEFSSVVCAVSHGCVLALAALSEQSEKKKPEKPVELSVSLQDIFRLYFKISALPIGDILASMDQLYLALVELMDEYGLEEEQTWEEWMTTNWWIPPVIVTGLVLSLVKHHNYRIISEIAQ